MLILSKITMTYKNNQAFFYNCLKFNHKDIIKELIFPIFHILSFLSFPKHRQAPKHFTPILLKKYWKSQKIAI